MAGQVHTLLCRASCRLDLLLRQELPAVLESKQQASNSKIRRLIVAGCVRVDGRQVRIPGFTVRGGSSVSVFVDKDKFFYEKPADDIAFELSDRDVLYEDAALIVVNKPAFFPSEPTMVQGRDNLHAAVVRYLHKKNPSLRNPPYAGIMHRLDHETSGVILFTKTRAVNGAVHDMFEHHTAHKVYRAVALCPPERSGPSLPSDTFCVDNFMGRISPKSSAAKWGVLPESRGGVHARTEFTVLSCGAEAGGRRTVTVEARPLTGRTHQIRVHMALSGMPLLGDVLYGGIPYERIMLHAYSLTFPHPEDGRTLTVTAPLPKEFLKFC